MGKLIVVIVILLIVTGVASQVIKGVRQRLDSGARWQVNQVEAGEYTVVSLRRGTSEDLIGRVMRMEEDYTDQLLAVVSEAEQRRDERNALLNSQKRLGS